MTDPLPVTQDLGAFDEPVLIFGGVYSNLEAFEALIAAANAAGIAPQRMIHSGDIIAYGADPADCAATLRDLGCPAIQGNVEAQIAAGAMDCGCGFDEGSSCDALSARWYMYAQPKVPQDLAVWMGALPDHIRFSMAGIDVRVVHGAPSRVNRFLYGPEASSDFEEELALAPEQLIVGGHCGFPFYHRFGARGWLNTGAVGITADDGTPRTWYATLTPVTDGIDIAIRALDYNHGTAVAKLRDADLPEPYAVALEGGPLPNRDTLPDALRARAGKPLNFTVETLPAKAQAA